MKFGDVSPLAGMVTGEGALGKLIAQGVGGLLPAAIARSAQRDSAEEERQKAIAAGQAMKKGGKVSASTKKMAKGGSASRRADGIAQRGKTRGKLV